MEVSYLEIPLSSVMLTTSFYNFLNAAPSFAEMNQQYGNVECVIMTSRRIVVEKVKRVARVQRFR